MLDSGSRSFSRWYKHALGDFSIAILAVVALLPVSGVLEQLTARVILPRKAAKIAENKLEQQFKIKSR